MVDLWYSIAHVFSMMMYTLCFLNAIQSAKGEAMYSYKLLTETN